MENVVAPKFSIGQTVRFHGDNDDEAGEVVSFSYDVENGWCYKLTARELDIPRKKIIDGFKTCREDELVAVDTTAAAAPTDTTTQQPTTETAIDSTTEGVTE